MSSSRPKSSLRTDQSTLEDHALKRYSIRPLPAEVAAAIKSSTVITSLDDAVIGLLKNALDSGAHQVDISIDYAKGNCTVEDDGSGIDPRDMSDEGGLGKPFYTSKHNVSGVLGSHGTFLAALTPMSILTVTSRHDLHRTATTLIFHSGKVISRLRPAPAQHDLVRSGHGTRVTVTNLFGSMPVRVKQRAAFSDEANVKKALDTLRRHMLAFVLSWQDPVLVRARDARGTLLCSLRNSQSGSREDTKTTKLSTAVPLFRQAFGDDVPETSEWIPVVAKAGQISISGTICLLPTPTKRFQFLSIGVRPLLSRDGHNELYDTINGRFTNSRFGTTEDEAEDELGSTGKTHDGKAARAGLALRKGVDRWPMFYLHIDIRDERAGTAVVQQDSTGSETLTRIIDVVESMTYAWLEKNHFRPVKRRAAQFERGTGLLNDVTSEASAPSLARSSTPGSLRPESSPNTGQSRKLASRPNQRPATSERTSSFSTWSRIKTGDTSLLEKIWEGTSIAAGGTQQSPALEKTASPFIMPQIARGRFGRPEINTVAQDELSRNTRPKDATATVDSVAPWTDPTSRDKYVLNARTGGLMPTGGVGNDPMASRTQASRSTLTSSGSQTAKICKSTTDVSEGRLARLLSTWENPVFQPSKQEIPRCTTLVDSLGDTGQCDKASDFALGSGTISHGQISRESLRSARVISQVDRKFILIKTGPHRDCESLLVLVDQHAADERCQVEQLFAEMFLPDPSCPTKIAVHQFDKAIAIDITHGEVVLFQAHALDFSDWGIYYELQLPLDSSRHDQASGNKDKAELHVTALPEAIAERCKQDRKALTSLLRHELWKFAETPRHARPQESTPHTASWISRLSACPRGIVEMINSRACRSAIMFNDALDRDQCEDLIKRLAQCTLPFQCAHGRPSMVPLVNVGQNESAVFPPSVGAASFDNHGTSDGFSTAYRNWKNRKI